MAEPLKHRPFEERIMSLKPDKIREGVVKRNAPDAPLSSSKIRKLFEEKKADRAPVDVVQPPPESGPEPVAPKRKYQRSPESIAKQKATLAKKKRAKSRASGASVGHGKKAAFVLAHPTVGIPELVKLAAKQGIPLTQSHAYKVRQSSKGSAPAKAPKTHGPSPNGASIGDLLQAIVDATSEIQRRLSQLTL